VAAAAAFVSAAAPSGVAQFEQNLAPGFAGVPQFGQAWANGDAHSWQKREPASF
jgi:hypothetical protein